MRIFLRFLLMINIFREPDMISLYFHSLLKNNPGFFFECNVLL